MKHPYRPDCDCDDCLLEGEWVRDAGRFEVYTVARAYDSTVSQPGPGRQLDRFFGRAGHKLHRGVSWMAQRMGKGPSTAEERLAVLIEEIQTEERKIWGKEGGRWDFSQWDRPDALCTEPVLKQCRRLMKYTTK